MTHPQDLLADYVDGTLDERARAAVEAHLAGCASCTQEVDLARRAVTALARLEDEPVPFGVTGPVLAEAGRRVERRRAVAWERLQWAAGAVAAAALVVVVVLNLTGDGGSDRASTPQQTIAAQAEAGGAAPGAEAGSALAVAFGGLERQQAVDYDDAGIVALARDAVPLVSGRTTEAADQARFAPADDALACLERGGAPTLADPRDTLLRLLEAEYAGTPAYIAVYAEGPGAGQPADRVVVWALAVEDCRILTTATLRI